MSANQNNSPVDNLTYDLITALQNKLQAISVYDNFLRDAQGDESCKKIFQQLQQDDRKHAEMLKAELARHMAGK